MTREHIHQASATHFLETPGRVKSQEIERMRPRKGHSLPGDHIGWDKSGHEEKVTEREALTNWRPHWEAQDAEENGEKSRNK